MQAKRSPHGQAPFVHNHLCRPARAFPAGNEGTFFIGSGGQIISFGDNNIAGNFDQHTPPPTILKE
jgi:hypothetical protein